VHDLSNHWPAPSNIDRYYFIKKHLITSGHPIQSNSIQSNSIQFNPIQSNSIQFIFQWNIQSILEWFEEIIFPLYPHYLMLMIIGIILMKYLHNWYNTPTISIWNYNIRIIYPLLPDENLTGSLKESCLPRARAPERFPPARRCWQSCVRGGSGCARSLWKLRMDGMSWVRQEQISWEIVSSRDIIGNSPSIYLRI